MDNWGCVDEANLFSSSYGKIEPLVRLVESLDSSDYDDLKYNQIFSANLDQNVEVSEFIFWKTFLFLFQTFLIFLFNLENFFLMG